MAVFQEEMEAEISSLPHHVTDVISHKELCHEKVYCNNDAANGFNLLDGG